MANDTVLIQAGINAALASGLSSFTLPNRKLSLLTPLTLTSLNNFTLIGDTETDLEGGVEITDWSATPSPAILSLVSSAYRPSIKCADLNKLGINPGTIAFRDWGDPNGEALELYWNDVRMSMCRYPFEGWILTTLGAGLNTIEVNDSVVRSWTSTGDLWVKGFFGEEWYVSRSKVTSFAVNSTGVRIVFSPNTSYMCVAKQRVCFENAIQAMRPGCYWVDRTANILYFCPPTASGRAVVTVDLGSQAALVTVNGCNGLGLFGLKISKSRKSLVSLENYSRKFVAQGCKFYGAGSAGIRSSTKCPSSYLRSNEFYDIGKTGVRFLPDDSWRTTLVKDGIRIQNNIFRNTGTIIHNMYAIELNGVDNEVSNNDFIDLPMSAVLFTGVGLKVYRNRFIRVATLCGDCGAIYVGRDYTFRGLDVKHNYFKDIYRVATGSSRNSSVQCVYIDDMASQVNVEGNIFINCERGVLLGGGRDCTFRYNLFYKPQYRCFEVDRRSARGAWQWKACLPATQVCNEDTSKTQYDATITAVTTGNVAYFSTSNQQMNELGCSVFIAGQTRSVKLLKSLPATGSQVSFQLDNNISVKVGDKVWSDGVIYARATKYGVTTNPLFLKRWPSLKTTFTDAAGEPVNNIIEFNFTDKNDTTWTASWFGTETADRTKPSPINVYFDLVANGFSQFASGIYLPDVGSIAESLKYKWKDLIEIGVQTNLFITRNEW